MSRSFWCFIEDVSVCAQRWNVIILLVLSCARSRRDRKIRVNEDGFWMGFPFADPVHGARARSSCMRQRTESH